MDQSDSNSYYVKHNVEFKEYSMQQYVYHLGIVNVPEIIEYDAISKIMIMRKIDNNNLSHEYGEDATDIPDELFEQVVRIVQTLVSHNIEYPDLTGYNFVEDNDGKIWIIDFEHSNFKPLVKDTFVERFVTDSKYKKWNPRFK